jgi:hypothetical protein
MIGQPYCSLFEPTSKKMPSHAGRWPTHRTRSASPAAAGAQRLLAPLHDVPTSFRSAWTHLRRVLPLPCPARWVMRPFRPCPSPLASAVGLRLARGPASAPFLVGVDGGGSRKTPLRGFSLCPTFRHSLRRLRPRDKFRNSGNPACFGGTLRT